MWAPLVCWGAAAQVTRDFSPCLPILRSVPASALSAGLGDRDGFVHAGMISPPEAKEGH